MQELEELGVRTRLSEALVRHDVRGHIDRRLGRELKRMDDESFFADVVVDRVEASQRAQFADARLDKSELLVNQVTVDHRRAPQLGDIGPGAASGRSIRCAP